MMSDLKIGWQTALTYQAPQPMTKDSLLRVLDRMAEGGMNFLSILLGSPGRFDPNHDGICWPTDNPRLLRLQDATSPNSHWDTEFLREGIRHAASRGIDVNVMLHWHLFPPERVRDAYPDIADLAGVDRLDHNSTYCSRNPATRAYFLEMLTDVVGLYASSGVHSVAVEGPFAQWCGQCASCRRYYQQITGTDQPNANMRCVADNLNMRDLFRRIGETIKKLSPNTQFWVHSAPWSHRGHQPGTLLNGGVDCLMNYFCHDLYEPEAMAAIMEFIRPLACCPQTCVRDKATHSYSVQPKTVEQVRHYARSILDTTARAPNGIGALFFNEIYVSDAVRNAVYEECGRFMRGCR